MKIGIKPFCILCACVYMFAATDAYVSLVNVRGMQLARQQTSNAQNMCRPRIDYGAAYDPKKRPGRSESAVDILQRTHDMTVTLHRNEQSTPPRKIDYGAGYDPKNKPVPPESAVDILQRTHDMTVTLHRNEQSTPPREIDYGAGYDPKNKPVPPESAVDILQRTQDMTMATRKYEEKTPPRNIDYGAGYDPKNRPSEYQHVQTHKHNSTLSHGVIVLKLFIESYENAQM